MNRFLRLSSLCLLVMALTACGFHLRGYGDNAELPESLQTLQLSSADPGNGVMRALQSSLRGSGVTLADSGPYPELTLSQEQVDERILSLNNGARAGEYALRVTVSFNLSAQGELLIPDETVSQEQVYLADPDNAIAKNEEAELILDEIRAALAQQIVRQLQQSGQ